MLKIAGLLIGMCFVFALLPQSEAALVWEDDFNDGTYSPDWEVHNGTWSASGLSLEGEDVPYNAISRESNFRRGSRVFDVYIGEITEEFGFRFLIYPVASELIYYGGMIPIIGPSYGIGVMCNPFFLFIMETIDGVTTEVESYELSGWEGWRTINFTLGSSYAVTVHLDGELVLSATVDSSAVPSVPQYFYVCALDNVMLDNIVVRDTELDPTPTTDTTSDTTTTTTNGETIPPPPMDTTLLIAGAGVGVVLVVAVVFLRKR
jgi:hypothetical protein